METSIDLKIGLSAEDKLNMKEDILNIVKPSLKPAGTDTSTNILNFEEDKGMYVATDNGYWYYWNGSAYVYGGVFQAPEIPDGSITPEKTNFIGIGNNILNEDNITYNGKYLGKTGVFYANDLFRTYVVKLKVGTAYSISMTQATGNRFFYLGFATSPNYSSEETEYVKGSMTDFVSGSWYDSSVTSTPLQYTFTAEYEYLILSTQNTTQVPTIMLNEGNYPLLYEKFEYKINNINVNGNVLYGKKYVSCGDSFTEGDYTAFTDSNGLSGKNSSYFYDSDLQMWKTYPYWIAKRNNLTLINEAKCGSDFTNIEGANNPFSVSRYMAVPKDADYITLMFGLNETDLTTEQIGTKNDTTNTTLWGAYNIVFEYFLTNMPYAKIGVIIPDAWMTSSYSNVIKEICSYWGIPYLDLKDDIKVPMGIRGRNIETSPIAVNLRNKAFKVSDNDNHPNIEAHKYRSTFIENFLRSL